MFNTAGSFTTVYLILTAVLFILVLFEKYFINLEDKIRAKHSTAKKSVRRTETSKTARKNSTNNTKRSGNVSSIRKVPNTAA